MSFLHQLGISLQPLGNERAEIYELAKRNNFGIEVVDFAMPRILNDKNKYEELIAKNKSELLGFNDLSFHGPFIDIVLHSADEDIRTISRKKIERAISNALELHCKTIVFHTGINTLINNPSYSKIVIESHSEF